MTPRPLYLFLAAALIIGCGKKHPCEDPDALVSIAQDAVSSKLKAPSAAKFLEATVTPIDAQGSITIMGVPFRWDELVPGTPVNGFTVTGQVDAPNAFGVPIRESYSVTLECGNTSASPLHCKAGDVEWGTLYDLKRLELETHEAH